VARANVATDIKYEIVDMKMIAKPVFQVGYPRGEAPGNRSATVVTKLASGSPDALVYWAAYAKGVWTGNTMPTADMISQAASSSDARIRDFGNFSLSAGSAVNQGTGYISTVRNLDVGVYYDVFFVARNPLSDPGSDAWTDVMKIDPPIMPLDLEPPQITNVATQTWKSTAPDPVDGVGQYSGTVVINFSKALDYETANGFLNLTRTYLNNNLTFASPLTKVDVALSAGRNQITIQYNKAMNNSVITFPYRLSNGPNVAGYLRMQYVVKPSQEVNGETIYYNDWDVKFVTSL